MLEREVESVLETGVPKTSPTVGRVVSSNVSDQRKERVYRKEEHGSEMVGRLEDNQIIESKGEEEVEERVVPVLAEIDLNSIAGGKKSGKKAWKRRARQVSKDSGKEPLEAAGMECDSDYLSGKKRFYLRDETSPDKENYLSEKKIKLG